MSKETVTVPKEVLNSMKKAYRAWGEFLDEFEDYILSSDREFLSKMRKAKGEHKRGKTRSIQALKKELGV